MALLQQWGKNGGLLSLGLAGLTGFGTLAVGILPWNWSVTGTISSPRIPDWEHPLRRRILETLASQPGICYRQLQKRLEVANGTLRHHLDVLANQQTVTTMAVNGRTCYYAGAPSQLEVVRHMNVKDEKAAEMLPVGLSQVQKEVVTRLVQEPLPPTQAAMARELNRSRASVNSAVLVLRRRGVLNSNRLDLASHLHGLRTGKLDYEWLDERSATA
jgi:predicted transcriptional regulator